MSAAHGAGPAQVALACGSVTAALTRRSATSPGEKAELVVPHAKEKPWEAACAHRALARCYFSTGTTMPRRMTFWQKAKTMKVGMAATIKEANTTPGALRC